MAARSRAADAATFRAKIELGFRIPLPRRGQHSSRRLSREQIILCWFAALLTGVGGIGGLTCARDGKCSDTTPATQMAAVSSSDETLQKSVFNLDFDASSLKSGGGRLDDDLPNGTVALQVNLTMDSGAFWKFDFSGLDQCTPLKLTGPALHYGEFWAPSTGVVTGSFVCQVPLNSRDLRFSVEHGQVSGNVEIFAVMKQNRTPICRASHC